MLFLYFEDNSATTDAGALSNYVAKGISNTELFFCQLTNNYAGSNAGAVLSIAQQGINNLKINNTNFTLNKTAPTYSGGAVYILSDTTSSANNTKFNKCKYTANEAGFGGAVAYTSLKGTITSYIYQSLFTKNKADYSAAVDSYITNGTGNEFLVNCTIIENIASLGPAVETFEDGPGSSALQAANSIIWNNTTAVPAKDVYLDAPADQLINSLVGNANCAAAGSGTCSNSLYAINPLFVNPVANDYSLQPCSPAINAGIVNAATSAMDTTDLANNPRFIGTVNLGTYENGSPVVITWLGGTSSNWGTVSNWSGGVVPAVCNDAIVNSGTPFTPVVNGTFYCRKLTVNSGANVNVLTGSVLHVAGHQP